MSLNDSAQPRRGDWTQTYTGKQFWPLDPRSGDFDIRDIAHGLSHICRFAGQCTTFYSVAQHSVILSEYVLPAHSLEALLHDAPEAYIGDIPGPVKKFLPEFRKLESGIYSALAAQFGLPQEISEETKVADLRLLADEKASLMSSPPASWNLPYLRFGIRIRPWSPEEAKTRFLNRFATLTRGG